MNHLSLSFSCLLLLTTSIAHGSGFTIGAQGAGAYGKLGAAVATVEDASAIFFNPAALTKLKQGQFYFGGTVRTSSLNYGEAVQGITVSTNSKGAPAATPHFFLSRPLNEDLAIGLGVYTPYEIKIAWPSSHPQNDVVVTRDLLTTAISPTLAINLSKGAPGMRAAVAFDSLPTRYHLTRRVPYGQDFATANTLVTGTGFGARIALLYDPVIQSKIHFGLTWRSPVSLQLEGLTDFDSPPEYRAELPTDGDTTMDLKLPQNFVAGLAYDITPKLTIEIDAEWTQYSKYTEERFQWADGSKSTFVKQWKDSLSIRAGISTITALAQLRAGYEVSMTPVPMSTLDASFPDANRQSISVGAGFSMIEGVTFDIAGIYHIPVSRRSSYVDYVPPHKATYEISSIQVVASIGTSFGAF